MIAYFDTSGLIPLLIEELGSEPAGRAWDAATHVTSVRLIYVEARAHELRDAGRTLGLAVVDTSIDRERP